MNALLETFSCIYSEIMSNIISFFQKLIKGGVGIRAGGGLENFSKINKRGGTIIRYSRVNHNALCTQIFQTPEVLPNR